jgi:hypothetical protein
MPKVNATHENMQLITSRNGSPVLKPPHVLLVDVPLGFMALYIPNRNQACTRNTCVGPSEARACLELASEKAT